MHSQKNMTRLYLDNNATTALDPRVFKAMLAEFSGPPANPSSVHYFGQQAKSLLNSARRSIASFFGSKPEELIFTSGGTESLNLLIRGLFGNRPKGHLITTSIEHLAVYRTIQSLENSGVAITYLPVDLWGAPLFEELEKAILPNTNAIILSAANSETGVKLDIEKFAEIAERHEIPLIIDAVALIGKEPLSIPPGVSAIAFSGHKFHAPKGIGGVIARSSLKLTPLLTGGGQEFQRRAGTENLAGILGLAEAFQILREKQREITQHMRNLRDHLEITLMRELPEITVNGSGPRVANTSNLAFRGIDGESLLIHLDLAGVAASHGSACSSGSLEPSRVLLQMGVDRSVARSSLRFSVSRMNSREEIDSCIERLIEVVRKMRK
jgi:cysteine desulfurase